MKLADTQICVNCDELVEKSILACPSCTSEQLIPLSEWLAPLVDRQEIELVRTIAEVSE